MFLSVFDKKSRANNIANEMSKALFMSLGQIVEARIQPETLKRFHEENFEMTKILFFDDIDLPNISKLSLYGEGLGSTTLYNDYLTHGKIWYAVVKSQKYGLRRRGDEELRGHGLQQDRAPRLQDATSSKRSSP